MASLEAIRQALAVETRYHAIRLQSMKLETLTIGQIEKRFDTEWVLVRDPLVDDAMQVRSGTVLFHSKDRDEVYRQAIKLRPKRFAMLFAGKLPKDTAIVL